MEIQREKIMTDNKALEILFNLNTSFEMGNKEIVFEISKEEDLIFKIFLDNMLELYSLDKETVWDIYIKDIEEIHAFLEVDGYRKGYIKLKNGKMLYFKITRMKECINCRYYDEEHIICTLSGAKPLEYNNCEDFKSIIHKENKNGNF